MMSGHGQIEYLPFLLMKTVRSHVCKRPFSSACQTFKPSWLKMFNLSCTLASFTLTPILSDTRFFMNPDCLLALSTKWLFLTDSYSFDLLPLLLHTFLHSTSAYFPSLLKFLEKKKRTWGKDLTKTATFSRWLYEELIHGPLVLPWSHVNTRECISM